MRKEWIHAKRKILLLCSGVVAIAIIIGSVAVFQYSDKAITASTEITNWGLSFQNTGQCPIGNATEEFLSKYDAHFVGGTNSTANSPTKEKKIYLTFDAGYENGNTPKILESLKKHNAKATFFLVGNYLETQPELVKQMSEEGHTVGNHTWNHPDMSKIASEAAFKEELISVENKYKEITGQELPKLYRPPQGKYCVDNLKMAQNMGYKTIFWSLAYVDWYNDKQPTKEEAFSKLIPRIHPGAVVLLHSTSKTNADILDELLTKWEEEGYSFGTLSEICE